MKLGWWQGECVARESNSPGGVMHNYDFVQTRRRGEGQGMAWHSVCKETSLTHRRVGVQVHTDFAVFDRHSEVGTR